MSGHGGSGAVAVDDEVMAFWFASYRLIDGGLKDLIAFGGADAPCHVSFLAPDVNVEMQNFLGPLLPVARFLGIPVLDFDKYGLLFDAERTAEKCVPAATSFLRQYVINNKQS